MKKVGMDANENALLLVKRVRRTLMYSILLFSVAITLFITSSLGWFISSKSDEVGPITLAHKKSTINFFYSVDGIEYNEEDINEFVFRQLIPKKEVFFRVEIAAGTGNLILANIYDITKSFSLENDVESPVDLADVVCIEYINPVDGLTVNKALSELFAQDTRDITLFDNYQFVASEAGNKFLFEFKIYMHEDAGNEYQDLYFSFTRIVFTVKDS